MSEEIFKCYTSDQLLSDFILHEFSTVSLSEIRETGEVIVQHNREIDLSGNRLFPSYVKKLLAFYHISKFSEPYISIGIVFDPMVYSNVEIRRIAAIIVNNRFHIRLITMILEMLNLYEVPGSKIGNIVVKFPCARITTDIRSIINGFDYIRFLNAS